MATDRERAVELAQKLLRLAAPSSGTTEAEQTNAALRAVKLIDEHNLVVSIPEPVSKRKTRPTPPAPPRYGVYTRPTKDWSPAPWSPPPDPRRWFTANWTEVEITVVTRCVICKMPLLPGDAAFFDTQHGYRCHDISTCGD